jgi:hypothetical protein
MLKIKRTLFTGIFAVLVSLIVSLTPNNAAIGGEIESLAPTVDMQPRVGWEIKSRSGAAEIALAEHLTRSGAKMYGAYWCPHCYEQEQLFGKEAWKKINYVECAEDALAKPQPKVCSKAGVEGFPTWSVDGKLDAGVKKLSQLAQLTRYKGKSDFKYDRLFGK